MAWEGNHPDDRWFLNGGIPNSLIVPFKSQDPPPQHPALPNRRTVLASSIANVDTGLYLEESEVKENESLWEGVRMSAGNPGERFLICETLEDFEYFQGYADSIAELFHAQMERVEFLDDEDLCLRSLLKKVPEGYGLVLLGPKAKTHRKHLLAPLFHETLAMELPISLLIVPKTRWPISKILVLIKAEAHDDAAVEWGRDGLRLLVLGKRPGRVPRVLAKMTSALREKGFDVQAKQLEQETTRLLEGIGLPLDRVESIGSRAGEGRGSLPAQCNGCGAPLVPDEVEWHDASTAECLYCGTIVKAV